MKNASRSLVLFLEYVPETLGTWLRRSLAEGTGGTVFPEVVDQLLNATAWMNSQGFQHLDVHPGNILIREGMLLFTDFGLALHRDFDLTAEEEASMPRHNGFDRDSALMHLFHWTLFELGYTSGSARLEFCVLSPLTQPHWHWSRFETHSAKVLTSLRKMRGSLTASLLVRCLSLLDGGSLASCADIVDLLGSIPVGSHVPAVLSKGWSMSPSRVSRNRFQAWCGLIVGVCLAVPPLIRLSDQGWSGLNILLVTLGVLLILAWSLRLFSLNRVGAEQTVAKEPDRDS